VAFDPFITATDLSDRLGRSLTTDETSRADKLCEDASSPIRSYTRQTITRVAADVVTLRVIGGQVRLPQRPADRPTHLTFTDEYTNLTQTLQGWTFDGYDTLDLTYRGYIGNVSSRWGLHVHTVTVTYSHGYEEIPDDIVTVACGIALRGLMGPGFDAMGVSQEIIGNYSYRTQDGHSAGLATLTPDDRDTLDVYRRRTGTTALR
jgi:hypothetical protein